MLAHHDQSVHSMLPIWSHYANENWCMTGYHATSVIADAMVKNVGDFDRKHALQASINTANVDYFDGIGYYKEYHISQKTKMVLRFLKPWNMLMMIGVLHKWQILLEILL